jgi:hypothetical protein
MRFVGIEILRGQGARPSAVLDPCSERRRSVVYRITGFTRLDVLT